MLCSLCEGLHWEEILSSFEAVGHHVTYSDLASAASHGCDFCTVAQAAVLDTYSQDLSLPVEDVAQLHLEKDRLEYQRYGEDRTGFTIEPGHIWLDTRYAPCEGGVIGIMYGRGTSRIIGRRTSQKVELDLGLSWVRECIEKHPDCKHEDESLLPSRVIDVGSYCGDETLRLRQCSGQKAPYVTLSHCWGPSNPARTTSACYNNYLKSIPLAGLPRTYRDAVAVTRFLGIRYLWIDSLCIIQDSTGDWEKECVKMSKTYENSTVTIAGPDAPHCHAGFLDRQPKPAFPEFTFDYQSPTSKGTGSIDMFYRGYKRGETKLGPRPESNSVLSSRAWALQERLLSRRVLYFGSQLMYWECLTNVRYENLHFPFIDNFWSRGEVEKVSFKRRQSKALWLRYWYNIVTTYSGTNLTFSNDKLPALSGVASKIHNLLGYHYFAGLWKEDFPRGLAWYCSSYRRAHLSPAEPIEFLAPSWSWASQDGEVTQAASSTTSPFGSADLSILDVNVDLKGPDPFGQIHSAQLKVYGKVRTGIIRKLRNLMAGGEQGLFLCYGCLDLLVLGEYFPDRPGLANTLAKFDYIGAEEDGKMPQQTILFLLLGKSLQGWMAMAIEPMPEKLNKYRRIGLAKSKPHHFRDDRWEHWFDEGESMTVEMI
ncbi:hypothetical protein EPUS_00376 [Endocarpon pusillum Z07020]|uniref:Heterokaryon incompatibility domain-containing protein n=1 Tax=Endocarpon pusillum (strain Z07020 / HMAS-L-300199) TaxID=1263415 RepID=U1GDP8_ENDPU|nr:uncharacterized protein EPUS_00376 [Endocarpon pusillum Z07020]ERF70188.1 hypothetical protein EPUS_00376 [Endocarpon pusillum Z07020]